MEIKHGDIQISKVINVDVVLLQDIAYTIILVFVCF